MTFLIGMGHNKRRRVFVESGFSEVVKQNAANQELTQKSLSNNLVSHFLLADKLP
jgi:hypothetical protein